MDLGRELLLNLAVYGALALAAATGVAVFWRAGRWLPLARLRTGRWTGGAVLACFLLFLFLPDLLVEALDRAGFFFQILNRQVDHLRQTFILSPLTTALLFAVTFWLLHRLHGTHPRHVGLTSARWRANVRLGLAAFCVTTPIVLGLYFLTLLMTAPTPHPFERIARQGLAPLEWAFFGFSAIVAAPLLEEWLFRGLLQGWLRRASPLGHLVVAVSALAAGSMPFQQSLEQRAGHPNVVRGMEVVAPAGLAAVDPQPPPILWESLAFAIAVVAVYLGGVLRLWWPVFRFGLRQFVDESSSTTVVAAEPSLEGEDPIVLPGGPRWEEFKRANARWAVIGAAVLFALSHAAWPSAIPLIPLGLVLGWLAYRTQSLVPGIVLHMLFNAVAFLVLLIGTLYLHD